MQEKKIFFFFFFFLARIILPGEQCNEGSEATRGERSDPRRRGAARPVLLVYQICTMSHCAVLWNYVYVNISPALFTPRPLTCAR